VSFLPDLFSLQPLSPNEKFGRQLICFAAISWCATQQLSNAYAEKSAPRLKLGNL
jgi:hypothetical protein